MVSPILEYGSAIWGLKEFSCINAVHNRACRVFLGVRRHSPNLAIQAELGWKTPYHRTILNITRLLCRLTSMCHNRLTRKVFDWSVALARSNKKNWCFRVMSTFSALGLQHLNDVSIQHCSTDVLEYMDVCIFEDLEQKWHLELWNDQRRNGCGNKLRTYRTFKKDFREESYLNMRLTLSQRRALASLRCGVAPLRIETGRYSQLPVNDRICEMCDSGNVENEKHFLMSCNLYDDIRDELFLYANSSHTIFGEWSLDDQFMFLISNSKIVCHTAKACQIMLQRREHKLYR